MTTRHNVWETQQEISPELDAEITAVAEDLQRNGSDEFITYEQIRKVIGSEGYYTNLDQFSELKDLGHGGVGAILSGRERVLARDVAIKVLRPSYRKRKRQVGRIIREARATARIEHPNIVPIHALGVLDDVGIFFTMKKIAGETLQDVLQKLEDGSREYRARYTPSRLLEIFISVCHGVAFAHSKGIIHRDLKPANIMLGDFGEVLVMDWGLVKFKGENEESELFGVYSETYGDKMLTLDGTITGTPLFMSPEQASGWSDEVDEQSDIYSLGVILYAILTHRQSAFKNSNNIREVLNKVINADYPPPRKTARHKIPREIEAICLKAMSKRKCDRYLTVQDFLHDIRNYQEGYPVSAYRAPLHRRLSRFCRRNRFAVGAAVVAAVTMIAFLSVKAVTDHLDYLSYRRAAEYNLEAADQARMRAFTVFRQLKRERQDAAVGELQLDHLQSDFRRYRTEFENRYNMALLFFGKLEKNNRNDRIIRDGVSEVYKRLCEFAIACHDLEYADKVAGMVTMRSRNLSYLNDDARQTFLKMRAMATVSADLSISTIPVTTEVTLWHLGDDNSLSLPERLGKTPIVNYELTPGVYLAELKNPDYPAVRYPLAVSRAAKEDFSIYIPSRIPDGMVYIPGGELTRTSAGEKQVYIRSFFISRYEVTFEEYLRFWKTLPSENQKDRFRARRYIGRHRFAELWDDQGRLLPPYQPNLPVIGITAEAATAYCRWLGRERGDAILRLPSSEEWERAARGIDGRRYVWGNRPDPALTLNADNIPGVRRFPHAAPPGSFPRDVSIFGVCDMAGNVRELTSSMLSGAAASHAIRGASWATGKDFLHIDRISAEMLNYNDIGFRYVQEISQAGF